MNTSAIAILFNSHYNKAKQVPFQESWSNGTGYFDGVVVGQDAPFLKAGELVASECPKGRKLLLMGTPLGNLVVFQRYSNRDDIYATNTGDTLYDWLAGRISNPLTSKDIDLLFGLNNNASSDAVANIGTWMEINKERIDSELIDYEIELVNR